MKLVRVQASSDDPEQKPFTLYAVIDREGRLSDSIPAFGMWGSSQEELCPFELFEDRIDFGSGCDPQRYYDLDVGNVPLKEGRLLRYTHRGGTDAGTYKVDRITIIMTSGL